MQALRELDELEDAATGEDEGQAELGLSGLPRSIAAALRSGAESVAVRLAIRGGNRNEDQLTNLIFFGRYPSRWGQPLRKSDPNFQALSQEWLSIRANVVRPELASAATSPSGTGGLGYSVKPGEEYGGKWRSTRPPGLPASARFTSAPGAALEPIERLARQQGLGETFVRLVRHLAKTESGGRFALPAIRFNALPPAQRGGAKLITAWGAFSFNRDAWRALPGVAAGAFPWDATAGEEIGRPILRYAELFRQVRGAGGTELDAARGVRLWHRSPYGEYKPYLTTGRQQGFAAAWSKLSAERRARLDGYLRDAGILPAGAQELEAFVFEEELWPELEVPPSGIEDRTALSPRDKRKGQRDPASVTALVLHQMAFSRGNNPAKYDKVTSHFVILPNGHTAQLHPASSILWASNGFNKLTVAVEFAGNFPSVKGRCWEPKKFGCHRLTPEQIAAGRNLVRHLVNTLGIRHVLAHRQSSASRANDPGPDIWYHVGQWAVDTLGLSDGGPGFKIGSGNPIPPEWRAPR